jgi:predicted permease
VATRGLARSPGFAATAAASLALGLGAATAVFSLANGLFLAPIPGLADPARVVTVQFRQADGERILGLPHPAYRELADGATTLAGLAAFSDHTLALGAGVEAELLLGQAVSGNYFAVLGVEPAVGRLLAPGDDAIPGGHPVAVVSHGLWRRRFAGDPAVVGRTVTLNGSPFTVVGVAPAGFRGLFRGFRFDVWTPLAMAAVVEPEADLADRERPWLELAGRLAPGASPAAAAEELFGRCRAAVPAALAAKVERAEVRRATGIDDSIRGAALALVAVLFAGAGLLLAVGCLNVANLLLARAAARTREVAIRLANGAGRARSVSHLVMESLLLAAGGGAAGLLLAAWCVELLRLFQPPPPLALDLPLALDGRVMGFGLLAAAASALLCGLLPALRVSGGDLPAILKGSIEGGPAHHRLKRVFVVGQLAASLVLLAAAGLFVRTLTAAAAADPGFAPEGVEVAVLDLSLLRGPAAATTGLAERLEAAALALPGAAAAGVASAVPLGLGGPPRAVVEVPGHRPPPAAEGFAARWAAVTPGAFAALGLAVDAGRGFAGADGAAAPPVAVVGRAFAERFWGGGDDALGERFTFEGRSIAVVGVVADVKLRSLGEEPSPFFLVPFAQRPDPGVHLLVRRAPGAPPLGEALRRAVREAAPGVPLTFLLPLREFVGLAFLPQRIAGGVAAAVGIAGLLLAVVGVYGNLAYLVSRRRREIGVRMALGARRGEVMAGMVGEGLRLALLGVGVGIVLGLFAARLLAGFLYGVPPHDPPTFAAVAALLAAAAALASYLPARRAARVDPAVALRTE